MVEETEKSKFYEDEKWFYNESNANIYHRLSLRIKEQTALIF
jgi:hypothetical protein